MIYIIRVQGKQFSFTFVEIMIVVAILGLLISLSIPAFNRVKISSENSRIVNDYKTYAEAFKRYALENGSYPPDGGFNPLPTGMETYLPPAWTQSPVGGQWIWDYNQWGITAGVALRLPNIGIQQMQIVDSLIDDGDLSQGSFRKIIWDRYTFVIED